MSGTDKKLPQARCMPSESGLIHIMIVLLYVAVYESPNTSNIDCICLLPSLFVLL